MTRFARARGSKASNEKAPEDGTPWEVMKQQLLESKKQNDDSKKREEAEKQRIENYENFLKEHKVQKRKATWCDFPDDAPIKKDKNHPQPPVSGEPQKKKKKNKTKLANVDQPGSTNDESENITEDKVNGIPEKKKKKKKQKPSEENPEDVNDNNTHKSENVKNKKKLKQKYKNKQIPASNNAPKESNSKSDDKETTKEAKHFKQNNDVSKNANSPGKQKNIGNRQKNKKNFADGQPVRRKEINDRSFQLIINGKEVELARFDGFPIMKRDAERLQELKNSMIKKGIPKSEVQRTLKLERRRAEKALARMKRDVCYNCRKGGHNLSDCPDLKSKIPGVDAAEGVCFKCGSTEHRQFECRVQRVADQEFKFATCFICKEQGHIARQCPDNPKGLYPNGGGCKLCGDVTHLRKDCPTVNVKKQESAIKLQTLGDDNVEEMNLQTRAQAPEETRKPKKIKF